MGSVGWRRMISTLANVMLIYSTSRSGIFATLLGMCAPLFTTRAARRKSHGVGKPEVEFRLPSTTSPRGTKVLRLAVAIVPALGPSGYGCIGLWGDIARG